MFRVEFEIQEEYQTGREKHGLFGVSKETLKRWAKREGDIVGNVGKSSYLLIRHSEREWAWLDIFSNDEDEDGIMEVAYQPNDGDWVDIRNLKIIKV